MKFATLERLSKERDGRVSFISELADQVESEERDLVDTELAGIKAAEERVVELDSQIEPLLSFEKRAAAGSELTDFLATGPKSDAPQRRDVPQTRMGLGDRFVESDAFKDYNGRGTSATVKLEAGPFEMRAAADPIFESTQPGKGMLPNGGVDNYWRNEKSVIYPLLDYIGKMPTSAASIKWSVQHGATGAKKVAEGELKPFIEWTDEEVTVAVEVIAGVKKFSR